jgi:hypothetical protein
MLSNLGGCRYPGTMVHGFQHLIQKLHPKRHLSESANRGRNRKNPFKPVHDHTHVSWICDAINFPSSRYWLPGYGQCVICTGSKLTRTEKPLCRQSGDTFQFLTKSGFPTYAYPSEMSQIEKKEGFQIQIEEMEIRSKLSRSAHRSKFCTVIISSIFWAGWTNTCWGEGPCTEP